MKIGYSLKIAYFNFIFYFEKITVRFVFSK